MNPVFLSFFRSFFLFIRFIFLFSLQTKCLAYFNFHGLRPKSIDALCIQKTSQELQNGTAFVDEIPGLF